MNEKADRQVEIAGWLLMASSIAAIGLMSQHPSGSHGGIMTPLVHGGLQAMIVLQIAATMLIIRRSGSGLLVAVAAVAFVLGQVSGIGAATINGFIVPNLGSYGAEEIGSDIGRLAWESNQALARMGAVATGSAIALIGLAFCGSGPRWLAVFGIIAGLASSLPILGGHLDMDLHGALFVYITQWVWLVALGWVATRRT